MAESKKHSSFNFIANELEYNRAVKHRLDGIENDLKDANSAEALVATLKSSDQAETIVYKNKIGKLWALLGLFLAAAAIYMFFESQHIFGAVFVALALSAAFGYSRYTQKHRNREQFLQDAFVSHESSTFKEITALRQSIISMNGSEPDPEALADVQKKTNEVIKGLSITLENYPDLKANTVFLNQMNEIKEQNENVGAAIAIYNRNTETFNTYIESFPINGANALLARKKRIVEYSNLVAAENIGYKPNF